jgi:hypothetical protein
MVDTNLIRFGLVVGIIFILMIIYIVLKKTQKSQDSRLKKWEGIREKGVVRFIMIRGILLTGIPSMVLLILLSQLMNPESNLIVDIIYYSIIGLAAGIGWGYFIWWSSENSYKNWKGNFQ